METKIETHTPGPWRLADGAQRDILGGKREVVAHVYDWFGSRKLEAQANARLIASAPTLLEALEALLARATTMLDTTRTTPPEFAKARQTIALARRES